MTTKIAVEGTGGSVPASPRLPTLMLGALGVVYGDIGTSPLYTMKESFIGPHPLAVDGLHIFGVLSLIFWSLMSVVTIKYVFVAMRADNKGEGGSFALLSLISRSLERKRWASGLVLLGVLATSLFYGDAMITPAISVLSAVEGLTVVHPGLEPLVIPLAVAILIGLFAMQSRGTAKVGALFGPIVLVYFATLAVLGVVNISAHPDILRILNPVWAVRFFAYDPGLAFLALGSVFLAVTGAETLYADMGHFGRRAIGLSWLTLVYPCLMLNYMGQGALLLSNPAAVENPFFLMAPEWARLPLVLIATAATIIASQAVISGAFSITHQAVQLGFLPRLKTRHTSESAAGQIYIPVVNWSLLAMVVMLVLGFRESTRLASAYGIAVTGTMVITTIMLGVLVFQVWRWNRIVAALTIGLFLIVDGAFFASNITKVADGGWFPLLTARRDLHDPDHVGHRPKAHAGAAYRRRAAVADLHQVDREIRSSRARDGRVPVTFGRSCPAGASAQFEAQPGASRASADPDREGRGRALRPRRQTTRSSGCRERLLPCHPSLRFHGRAGHSRCAGAKQGMRTDVRHDEHELLPRPAEADRVDGAPGHGPLARAPVRLDAEELRIRNGVLQAPDEPRDRARQPIADLRKGGLKRHETPETLGMILVLGRKSFEGW